MTIATYRKHPKCPKCDSLKVGFSYALDGDFLWVHCSCGYEWTMYPKHRTLYQEQQMSNSNVNISFLDFLEGIEYD